MPKRDAHDSIGCELKNGSTAQKLRQLLFKPTIFFFCWFLPTSHSHSHLFLIHFLFKPLWTHTHTHTQRSASIIYSSVYSKIKLKLWISINGWRSLQMRSRTLEVFAHLFLLFFFMFVFNLVGTWLAEVSSIEWEFINMTDQEEDLIYRMYRLVGAK